MQQDNSGFFNNITTSKQSEFNSLELIYSSEDGFNVIYKATKQNKRYILKALKTEYAANPIYESLLVKEFEIISQLDHPNIGQSYGLDSVATLGSVIIEEYIDGVTLDEYLNNNTPSKDEIDRIASQICDALSYAHKKQIIHRDLKPQNIMVTHNGANVKLIDFGLADSDSHIAYKDPAGTPSYSSPEQMAGEEIDLRSDIYSLGVVLSKFNTNTRSPQINKVIKKCCTTSRELRYNNCEEIKQELVAKSRNNLLLGLAVLLVVGIAMSLYFIVQEPTLSTEQSHNIEVGKESVPQNTASPNAQSVERSRADFEPLKNNLIPIITQECYPLSKTLTKELQVDDIDLYNDEVPAIYFDSKEDSLRYSLECYDLMSPIINGMDISDDLKHKALDFCKDYIASSATSYLSTARNIYACTLYFKAIYSLPMIENELRDSLYNCNPQPKYLSSANAEGMSSEQMKDHNETLKLKYDIQIGVEWVQITRSRQGLKSPSTKPIDEYLKTL